MIFFKNADITIYNKYYDIKNDIERYQRTIIEGVDWQSTKNVKINNSTTDKGLNRDYSILIFLDKLDNYIGPKKFNKLSDKERMEYFTLKPGDYIVKGVIDFEVTGIKPNNIATLKEEYDDVYIIVGIKECDSHWEVECK